MKKKHNKKNMPGAQDATRLEPLPSSTLFLIPTVTMTLVIVAALWLWLWFKLSPLSPLWSLRFVMVVDKESKHMSDDVTHAVTGNLLIKKQKENRKK
jgi:hypothetical protein